MGRLIAGRVAEETDLGVGSPNVAEEIFVWIGRFRSERIGVLLIDHNNVRRVVQISDCIYVLSLGEIAAAGQSGDFSGDLHGQVRKWVGLNY